MPVKPAIALCSIEKDDFQKISEHVEKEFSESEISVVEFSAINSFAAAHETSLIILKCHEQQNAAIRKQIEDIKINHPDSLIILLVPHDRSDLISLALTLQVFFFLIYTNRRS